jgi:serine/threonine protein kinase
MSGPVAENLLLAAELAAHERPAHPGVPRYVDVAAVGAGAYSTVFRAYDTVEGLPVAVKAIRRHTPEKAFHREVSVQRRLAENGNPHFLRLLDSWTDARAAYLVLELCEGDDLFARLQPKRGPPRSLAPRKIKCIAKQLVSAVAYMHALGVWHLDLKLENVMFKYNGQDHVVVIDFGLSQEAAKPAPEEGSPEQAEPVGSVLYLSPEMSMGRGRGPNADWWALGVMLYVMHTGGTFPFDVPDAATATQNASAEEYRTRERVQDSPKREAAARALLLQNLPDPLEAVQSAPELSALIALLWTTDCDATLRSGQRLPFFDQSLAEIVAEDEARPAPVAKTKPNAFFARRPPLAVAAAVGAASVAVAAAVVSRKRRSGKRQSGKRQSSKRRSGKSKKQGGRGKNKTASTWVQNSVGFRKHGMQSLRI